MNQQPTYTEASAQLNTAAQRELLKGISKDWTDFEDAARRIKSRTIFAVNKLRSIGLKIQQVSGHEQLSIEFFASIREQLPKSMRFIDARCAIHISHRLEKDAENFQEAAAAQRDLFLAIGDYKEPKRIEAQSSHDRNPISDFVSWGSSFTRIFGDLNKEPMERWRRDELETFVKTTKPIAERHMAAAKLLGGAA